MPKDNPKITYTTSIDRELRDRFKIHCAMKGRYQNEVLEELIEKWLQEEGEKGGNTN